MSDTTLGVAILIGIILLVIVSGGTILIPQNIVQTRTNSNISITPNQQLQNISNEVQDLQEKVKQAELAKNASPYKGKVRIGTVNPSQNYGDSFANEYITIQTTYGNKESIPITGWSLRSTKTGINGYFGVGVYLPYPNKTNNINAPILLAPGDSAIISTVNSPIGMNFKTNTCVGYFTENYRFLPGLYSSCPGPKIDNLQIPIYMNDWDVCRNYITSRPQCRVLPLELPDTVSSACRDFIKNKFTYDSCVLENKDSPTFSTHEWRIYLDKYGALWRRDHEEIMLLDQNGKIVDIRAY